MTRLNLKERVEDQAVRSKARREHFTETNVLTFPPLKDRQYLVWDTPRATKSDDAAKGLAILVSPKGAKSYRCAFHFPGNPKTHYMNLGRVGEMKLAEARELTRKARREANEGVDPRADDPKKSDTFETVFKDFIQRVQIEKRQNKSAGVTQKFVLNRCTPLLQKPVGTIAARDVENLIASIGGGEDGRRGSAIRIFTHLSDFFRWCERPGGPIKTHSPMRGMEVPYELAHRDRFYTNDEIKTIWKATDELEQSDRAYIKLILLLGLRKQELAQAKWSEFDNPDAPTLFTVPFERTKGSILRKRKGPYLVPLVPLAQRIVQGLSRDGEMVFKRIDYRAIKNILVEHGTPEDFTLHAARHTVATWLQNHNHSEWEVGLVLNHAASTVTARYSHGYPLDLKRKMLEKWADHVEQLVTPGKGVAVLR